MMDERDLTDEEMDERMREQMRQLPEVGGPRDPAIGEHPRFKEMDARREAYLRRGTRFDA